MVGPAHGLSWNAGAPPFTAQARPAAAGSGLLSYNGGPVATAPAVYIAYWGNQWGTTGITNDPSGEAALQLNFLSRVFGPGGWSSSQTQYCEGVPVGTVRCNGVGTPVGEPSSNPVRGTWLDSAVAAPSAPGPAKIAAEAVRAAKHFGVSGDNVQIIVDAPTKVVPQGFGTQYCAWHDSTTTATGAALPYTNFPYMTDAGNACFADAILGNPNVNPATEGITIIASREYAEVITDPGITGWFDSAGAETADKCGPAIVSLHGVEFAVSELWSNSANNGAGGCVPF
jgi:serine protease